MKSLLVFCLALVSFSAQAAIVIVETNPPVAVPIFMDGKELGVAPATVLDCSAGKHKLTIRHPDFRAKVAVVDCSEDYSKVIMSVTDLRWELKLTSEPSDLVVSIGGKSICRTPCVHYGNDPKPFEVVMKSANKELASKGLVWRKRIRMKPAKKASLKAKLDHGFLRIKYPLNYGLLVIEGVGDLSTTPRALAPGTYSLKLEQLGTDLVPEWRRKEVEVSGNGELVIIEPPLFKAAQGKLRLESKPDGARVFANKKKIAETPVEDVAMAAGKYRLKVKKRRYRPVDFDVEFGPGDKVIVEPLKLARYSVLTRVPGGGSLPNASGVALVIGLYAFNEYSKSNNLYLMLNNASLDNNRQVELAADMTSQSTIAGLAIGLAGIGYAVTGYYIMNGEDPE
jgi:hypothetical protein